MPSTPPTYLLSLDAVIIAVTADTLRVLCVRDTSVDAWSLPSGPLDPIHHPTMERGLRDWVQQQTGLAHGYVEQLYTYGDRERDPRERELGMRVLSTAYLALVREQPAPDNQAQWVDCYGFLPWEDWRRGRPALLDQQVRPRLLHWAGRSRNWFACRVCKHKYLVGSNHPTYKTDGYNYRKPFPNVRLAYKINDNNKLSLFYNRRVDRPNEVDIRIFPKYDDAEIIKVGNPALRPQFTHLIELGYKTNWKSGYFYSAAYHRLADATITRIRTIVPNTMLIYSVMQNAGRSYATGVDITLSQDITKLFSFNLNLNGYHNRLNAFAVVNKYPQESIYSSPTRQIFSGNAKLNTFFHLPLKFEIDLSAIYLAPDLIPASIGSPADGIVATDEAFIATERFPADGLPLADVERGLLLKALHRTNWNVTRAGKLLGLSRDTMRYRIDKFQLTPQS